MVGRILTIWLMWISCTPTGAADIQTAVATDPVTLKVFIDIVSRPDFTRQDPPEIHKRLIGTLNRSGLAYQIIYLPWNRAMSRVKRERNSLIFQLLRTAKREAHYEWLMPVTDDEPMKLFGVAGQSPTHFRIYITQQKLSAACIVGSAQCEQLRDLGFADNRILKTSRQQPYILEQLLVSGRVDFIPAFESTFQGGIRKVGDDISRYQSYAVLDNSVDYLAAYKGKLHNTVIQRLADAAQGEPKPRL